jgi:hypothetical protein
VSAISGSALFGRSFAIAVGPTVELARTWTDLRASFKITQTAQRTPSKATVEIYNLSEDSSTACREKGAVLQVIAGYGDAAGRLFLGGIDRSWREVQQTDSITYIEASDGGRQFRTAFVNKSFSGEVTASRVLNELATAAGLPLGSVGELPDVRIAEGLVLSGSVRDQMDRVAVMLGVEWWIQDEQLVVLAGSQHTGESAVVIGPDSGLIGSPTPAQDPKKKGLVEVVSLLQPSIRPGRRFELESRQFDGVYRAESVEHSGDPWAQDWYTKITAREAS